MVSCNLYVIYSEVYVIYALRDFHSILRMRNMIALNAKAAAVKLKVFNVMPTEWTYSGW